MEKENIKNIVIIALVLFIAFGFLFGDKNKSSSGGSQPITLYKFSVTEGQSVISFINHNDPMGIRAKDHCERIGALYEKRDNIKYICSDIQYDKYKLNIK